jgi:hypothetical protein
MVQEGVERSLLEKQAALRSDLVHSALWYSNRPTSSISAERTFAFGRIADSPQRSRQCRKAFAREIKMKASSSILKFVGR